MNDGAKMKYFYNPIKLPKNNSRNPLEEIMNIVKLKSLYNKNYLLA